MLIATKPCRTYHEGFPTMKSRALSSRGFKESRSKLKTLYFYYNNDHKLWKNGFLP